MNVLITGGTGFIGSRLALRCIEDGHNVRVFGRENNDAERANKKLVESKGAEVVLGSITDKEKFSHAVKEIDIVFHLAAAQHEANVGEEYFKSINVDGTRNVLEAAVKAGVKRFVNPHQYPVGLEQSLYDLRTELILRVRGEEA